MLERKEHIGRSIYTTNRLLCKVSFLPNGARTCNFPPPSLPIKTPKRQTNSTQSKKCTE